MKNDAITTVLNFVLATTVIFGLLCAYLAVTRDRDQRGLAIEVNQYNAKFAAAQSLIGDVSNYYQQTKNPEINRMLQTLLAKAQANKLQSPGQ